MKLLASDLDGTLYFGSEDVKVKPQDIQAIKDFQKAGHLFGICSGRTYAGICHALEKEDVHLDFYILVSGACLMDGDGHYLYAHRLSKSLIEKIVNLLAFEKEAHLLFCANENYYHFNTPEKEVKRGIVIHSMSEAKEALYDSLHISFERLIDLEKVKALLIKELGNEIEVHHNVLNLDITPKGCSKGKALLTLNQYLPVKFEDIAAIGDSFNDISMLEAAKTSFTFHSSDESVKKHATHIVNDIAEAITILEEEKAC